MAVATPSVADATGDGARADWETPSAAALTWVVAGTAFLALGGLLLLLTAVQQISPGFFGDSAVTSVERLRPAALVLLVHGGLGMLAGGVALDVVRRATKAPVRLELVARAAGALTTLAVAGGTAAAVAGWTGRLDVPKQFAAVLALAQLLLAAVVLSTIATRRSRSLHPSLWFVALAVVGAPVVLLTGSLPAFSGLNDAAVTSYARSGVVLMWLLPLAVGTALFVVPAACRAPLDSRSLVRVAFWGLLVTAPLAGPVRGVAREGEAWLETLAIAATIGLLVPLLAVVTLLVRTYARRTSLSHGADLRFALGGTSLLALALPLLWLNAARGTVEYAAGGVFPEGLRELLLAGATGMLLAAGAYHVVPVLTGNRLSNPRLAAAQAWVHVLGAVTVVLALLVAGYVQGVLWNEGVTAGEPVYTTEGMRSLGEAVRPLLWLRVAGEALLAGSWIVLFQQVFSTMTYGEPLAGRTESQ